VLEKKRLRDEVARQLQRLERELAEARQQQLSMLPDEFPPPDPAHPVAVHGVMVPAREVGGDLYDCFEVSPNVLCLAIGDVSGKGMPAALFMARTRSLLRASALQHAAATGAPPAPSAVAAVLNEELCKNNPAGMFVTLFLGFLDIASGQLEFVNAGHPLPYRLGDAVTEIAARPGPPLGVMPGIRYDDHAAVLGPGEALVLMTDGLPEMTDPEGGFYTPERVEADLHGLRSAMPEVITTSLAANVLAFAAGAPAADDVTVLAVRRQGQGSALDPPKA
jgi:serine phosphatase RsbU (regulator of sigma subunit)